MIRYAAGVVLAILALLLVWPGGPQWIGIFVQPWAMGVVALFTIAPSLIAGRFAVWPALLDLRRKTPLDESEKAVLDGAREGARRGGLASALLGLMLAAGSISEPMVVFSHMLGGTLVGLIYGLAVSELVLAPLGLIARR
jgi:hypothetical protein